MGFPKIISFAILLFLLLLTQSSNGQIIFKELPGYRMNDSDSTFFDIGQTRHIIPLNGTWQVYKAGDKAKNKVSVGIPSVFKGNGELVFEKNFDLSPDQIKNHNIRINFLGIDYTADISVNNVIIYRHSGGTFPFSVELPRDILHSGKSNTLSVKLYYKLDSENTIPLKQRFLFPQNFGGIIRDVYLQLLPSVSITDITLSDSYLPGPDKARITVHSRVENREFRSPADSVSSSDQYTLRIKIVSPAGGTVTSPDYSFSLPVNKLKDIVETIDIASPALWSPSDPRSYIVKTELWNGNNLVDKSSIPLGVYSLKQGSDSLLLNGSGFTLKGVTYIPSFGEYGSLATYKRMEQDIKMIKELGFNTVRFAKAVPHPYYLDLCEKYGLLAFVELPINSVPEQLAGNQNFITRSKNYLINFLKGFNNYSAIAAVGVGSSYLTHSDAEHSFIKTLASIVKKNSNFLTYASFSGFGIDSVSGLDLYGVELFNTSISSVSSQLKDIQSVLGAGRVFISSATYMVNIGNTNGYVNDHSFEAQAKYFEDLIDYSDQDPGAGYFINSMFDYQGDYASLTAGYSKDNLYQLGISGEDRSTTRLGYKVIYSKLHNTERVTIPIGSKTDDSPMVFVLFGLFLALAMGVLVNSGRKFREDASRALLRPYNFYADVRDQRIMSGYHSTILSLIIAAITALIIANLLYYFRENVVFEKILLSFGSAGLLKTVSYLAWHPAASLAWLSLIFIVGLLVSSLIVKAASFFVKTRVYYSSIYFSLIWSFLPFVLLIPVGIILYRILNADIGNPYIYIGLILFGFWIFYRLMKGIYVIFDVNAGSVYFYSILLVVVILGGMFLYYQVNNSVMSYLQLTFKQYHLLG